MTSHGRSHIAGILDVHVIQAEGLEMPCLYGSNDIYANFSCGENHRLNRMSLRTRTVKGGGSNPVFNQRLQIGIPIGNVEVKCELWMAGYNRGAADDKLLGYAPIHVAKNPASKTKNEACKFHLLRGDCGQVQHAGLIKLVLSYHPKGIQKNAAAQPAPLSGTLAQILSGALSKSLSACVASRKRSEPDTSSSVESGDNFREACEGPEVSSLGAKKSCLGDVRPQVFDTLHAWEDKQDCRTLRLGALCLPDLDISPRVMVTSQRAIDKACPPEGFYLTSSAAPQRKSQAPVPSILSVASEGGELSPGLLSLWEGPTSLTPLTPMQAWTVHNKMPCNSRLQCGHVPEVASHSGDPPELWLQNMDTIAGGHEPFAAREGMQGRGAIATVSAVPLVSCGSDSGGAGEVVDSAFASARAGRPCLDDWGMQPAPEGILPCTSSISSGKPVAGVACSTTDGLCGGTPSIDQEQGNNSSSMFERVSDLSSSFQSVRAPLSSISRHPAQPLWQRRLQKRQVMQQILLSCAPPSAHPPPVKSSLSRPRQVSCVPSLREQFHESS